MTLVDVCKLEPFASTYAKAFDALRVDGRIEVEATAQIWRGDGPDEGEWLKRYAIRYNLLVKGLHGTGKMLVALYDLNADRIELLDIIDRRHAKRRASQMASHRIPVTPRMLIEDNPRWCG